MNQYRLYFDDDGNSKVIPKASGTNHKTTSLPTSSTKKTLSVVEKVRSFENLRRASKSLIKSKIKMAPSPQKLEYDPLRGTRTSLKGWVSRGSIGNWVEY